MSKEDMKVGRELAGKEGGVCVRVCARVCVVLGDRKEWGKNA